MYTLLKIISKIFENIPRSAGYFLFEISGFFKYLFSAKRKKTLKKNLEHILGEGKVTGSLLLRNYLNYSRYYFDLFYSREKMLKSTDFSQYQGLAKIMKDTTENYGGLVFCSMHVGSWDFGGGFLCSIMPGQITVVVEELSPPVYKWFTETREKFGMNVLKSTDLKGMLKALKNKQVLVLLVDRDLARAGYKMELFGKKAYIPSGPANLALMAKVPIVFSVIPRDPKNKYIYRPYHIPPIFNLEKLPRTEENIEKLTKGIIMSMEKVLVKNYDQWCMLQQVWVDDEVTEHKSQITNHK